MTICRSAPFALRLLDVDYFCICDFESLRVAGLHHCSAAFRGGGAELVSPHLRHCCLWQGQPARRLWSIHNISMVYRAQPGSGLKARPAAAIVWSRACAYWIGRCWIGRCRCWVVCSLESDGSSDEIFLYSKASEAETLCSYRCYFLTHCC